MQLKVLATIHNFIMFIISLVCFIAMTYSLGMTLWNYQDGWERLTCDTNNTIVNRGTLYYWIYLFYLSKAYEMLDTVIMVLRKVCYSSCLEPNSRPPLTSCMSTTTA